jgi:hypothetical protein
LAKSQAAAPTLDEEIGDVEVGDVDSQTQWTAAEVDEATATGGIPPCWWCPLPRRPGPPACYR